MGATLYQKGKVQNQNDRYQYPAANNLFLAEITGNRAYAVKSDDSPKLIKPISDACLNKQCG